jgi:5-(carboxyamino)imidazole ribonucleotide mutase
MDKIIDVAVIMGSDSDLPTMAECLKIFDTFGVSYSINVGSAHRTPEHVKKCVQKSIVSGAKVFIAVAGMSAALPGVVASETTLPVIGVPMDGKYLASMDALFSVSQMPPFMPVACVSIGKAGAINSAILAIQILALNDAKLAGKFKTYREDMTKSIIAKDEKLNKSGYVKYIGEMKK